MAETIRIEIADAAPAGGQATRAQPVQGPPAAGAPTRPMPAQTPNAPPAKPADRTPPDALSGAANALRGLGVPGADALGGLASKANQVDQGFAALQKLLGGPAAVAPPKPPPAAPTPAPAKLPAGVTPKAPPAAAASGAAEAGAGEAAAAGGGAELAAVAGPIGLVVAAAMMVKEKIEKAVGDAVRAVGNVAERAGGVGTALAGNRQGDAGMQAAEGANEALKVVPVVGEKLALVGEQAIKVVSAFRDVTRAFIDRAQELERYSPELAVANARAEIRSMQLDIREADTLGPGLEKLIDAQSDLEATFREILLPLKEWLIENLAVLVKDVGEFVKERRRDVRAAAALAQEQGNIAKAAFQAATFQGEKSQKTMEGILRRLHEAMQDKAEAGIRDLSKEMIDMLDRIAPAVNWNPQDPGIRQPDLNIPVVQQALQPPGPPR